MNTQPIADTMDSAIQRLENLKSKTMSDLKKGDLVMTKRGLAWYVKFSPANDAELYDASNQVKLLTGETYFSDATPTKATKEQVTKYIRGLGWYKNRLDNWINNDNPYWVKQLGTLPITYTVKLDGALHATEWNKAPAMQAEAIQVATLLNAVKD